MGLNLDKDTGYTPWGSEPTPEELEELKTARYIVRQIGKPAIYGYSDSKERALGKALHETLHNMLELGMVVEIRDFDRQIELRISDDRNSTIVQWISASSEQTDAVT
jgi:hypothetical protein